MMNRMSLGRRVGLIAIYGERYVVSIIFLGLAAYQINRLIHPEEAQRLAIQAAPFTTVMRQVTWVPLYVYWGLLLLLGRRVTALPERPLEILLPVATTFFYLAYNVIPWLPGKWHQSLCPPNWQGWCAALSLVLTLGGLWIAMWATVHLGRSFGVLVEVRQVVIDGAYKWVRHPMYAGYVFLLTGFALSNFTIAHFLLVPFHIGLLLYRARLEEQRLADASPQYAEYRRRTGFVFPRLFRN